jgi:hypothetical protein
VYSSRFDLRSEERVLDMRRVWLDSLENAVENRQIAGSRLSRARPLLCKLFAIESAKRFYKIKKSPTAIRQQRRGNRCEVGAAIEK